MPEITASDLLHDIRALGSDLQSRFLQSDVAVDGLRARINELEQQLARRATGGGGGMPAFTGGGGELGHTVVNSSQVQALISGPGKRGRAIVPVGGLLAAITTPMTAAGTRDVLVAPDRGQISPIAQRRLTIRALLNATPTSSNAINYPKETGFTNNAAVVSEGATKPESTITFELATANVRTIAHWFQASKQILDDAPQLQAYLDGRLRYGVAYAEEQEILLGDGTGEHLFGLIPQATAFSAPFVYSGATRLDVLAQAITQVEDAQYPVTGLVLNSVDWREMQLVKDTTGQYLSSPFTGPFASLWNIPVVPSPAMPASHFLAGAFGLAAQLYDRQESTVEISTEDSDNFRRNLVTLRGEERVALAVSRPEAMVYGAY